MPPVGEPTGHGSPADGPGVLDTTARQLLAATARAQADGRVPSLVAAVVADGALAWSAGRGSFDDLGGAARGHAGADPADVQYRIGSITKTFAAVLVMRLRDEGRLRLDTPVGDLVPGTPVGDRTVGQLLGHGSGLQAETAGPWWERSAGREWPELVGPLGPDAVRHAAGRRFHYSNLGYGILGRLVEAVRGRAWADCLREEVLAPLGMDRTTPDAAAPAARGTAVHPWAPVTMPEPAPDYRAMAAAGQLWSTAADLGRFGRFLLGDTGGVLAPVTVQEMAEPGLSDGAGGSYGLGLQVETVDGRRVVGHGGSVPGFLASLLVDPAEQTAAVALANGTAGMDPALVPRLLGILRAGEPRVVPAWEPLPNGASVPLDALGPWFWGPRPQLLVQGPDGLLELRGLAGASRESRFSPAGPDTWVGLDGYWAGERLVVVRGADGTPASLDVGSFTLTRTPYEPGPTPGGVETGWA